MVILPDFAGKELGVPIRVRCPTSGVVMPILLLYAFGGTLVVTNRRLDSGLFFQQLLLGTAQSSQDDLTWVEDFVELRIPCVLWGFFARASCLNILTFCDCPGRDMLFVRATISMTFCVFFFHCES